LDKLFTKRNAWLVLTACLFLFTLCVTTSLNLRLDYDFEKFFPKNDPELDFYLDFREQFGTENDFLLLALPTQDRPWNEEFTKKLSQLTKSLELDTNLRFVQSLANYTIPVLGPIGLFKPKLLSYNTEKDSINILREKPIYGTFLSDNLKYTCVVIGNKGGISKKRSDAILKGIEQHIEEAGFQSYKMAGKIHGQHHYIDKMGSELKFFAILSMILLSIFLFVSFRNVWAIFLPISVVAFTVIVLLGIMSALDQPITVLSTILPTILFVVGISDVVHLLERYILELRAGKSKKTALKIAVKEVGMATFLTSLTTAIGFLTLLNSNIEPIANFGLFTAIGVCIAFVLTYTFFPAALLLSPAPLKLLKTSKNIWPNILKRSFYACQRYSKTIFVCFVLLGAVSAYFASNIKVNNYLLEDWDDEDPQKLQYIFFEDEFGGARPFEMALESKNGFLDYKAISFIDKLENYLDTAYKVNNIVSPILAIKTLNRASHGGKLEFYTIPSEPKEVERLSNKAKNYFKQNQARNLINEEGTIARISGRVKDVGGYIFIQRNEKLNAFIKENAPPGLDAKITGMPYLIDKNNLTLSSDMLIGLGIAFCAIAIIMTLLFRSFKMVVISLIPNLFPLLFIAGFMGITGIDLKVSTAIIFTIAFGIAVDDTIHFLSRYKLELRNGKTPYMARKTAYLQAGKAIIITSLILFSGFVSLGFSTFASTFYLGILVSITLILAVITDLFLLPIMLKWFKV